MHSSQVTKISSVTFSAHQTLSLATLWDRVWSPNKDTIKIHEDSASYNTCFEFRTNWQPVGMPVTAHILSSLSRYQTVCSVIRITNPAKITYLLRKSTLTKLLRMDAGSDCSSFLVLSGEDQLFPSTPPDLRNFLIFEKRRIKFALQAALRSFLKDVNQIWTAF